MTQPTTYRVQCHRCGGGFDAMAARWCNCGREVRSLVCPSCSNCFCSAPAPLRRRFWELAPRSLRESPQRFHKVIREQKAGADPSAEAVRSTVLVIDDDEAMRSLVACYVEQLGYPVMTASDGHEGLSMALLLAVDIIITDALMPRLDGREICRLIKQGFGDTKKVVLMTSLYRHERHRTEAHVKFGVDEYLTKPIDFGQLSRILERFAGGGEESAMSAPQTGVHYPNGGVAGVAAD